ncbi:MAG: Rab family GTPase [Candidatus Thorarchaeota archaeon]
MKKTIKVIVSGDGGVGKTSFLNRLINNSFDPHSILTKGVEFFSKNVQINGSEYNVIIWDFAGQRQFKKLLSDLVNGSFAAFVLFDFSRFTTLEGVDEWMKKLDAYGEIPTIILGSKMDVVNTNDMLVFDKYISEIRKNYKNIIGYLKISSKTGFNIEKAFFKLVKELSS